MRKADLPELLKELKNQSKQMVDVNIKANCIKMLNGQIIIEGDMVEDKPEEGKEDKGLLKVIADTGISQNIENKTFFSLDVLETAHDHISTKLEIPKRYYMRMTSEKNLPLLDSNVNHWIEQ